MDISSFYNISSGAVREAIENSSIAGNGESTGEFADIFDKAVERDRKSVV